MHTRGLFKFPEAALWTSELTGGRFSTVCAMVYAIWHKEVYLRGKFTQSLYHSCCFCPCCYPHFVVILTSSSSPSPFFLWQSSSTSLPFSSYSYYFYYPYSLYFASTACLKCVKATIRIANYKHDIKYVVGSRAIKNIYFFLLFFCWQNLKPFLDRKSVLIAVISYMIMTPHAL